MDSTGNAIRVAVQRRTGDIGAITVQIAEHIGFVDLRFELQMQVVSTLSRTTKPAVGGRGIIGFVAAGGDTDVIDTGTQVWRSIANLR